MQTSPLKSFATHLEKTWMPLSIVGVGLVLFEWLSSAESDGMIYIFSIALLLLASAGIKECLRKVKKSEAGLLKSLQFSIKVLIIILFALGMVTSGGFLIVPVSLVLFFWCMWTFFGMENDYMIVPGFLLKLVTSPLLFLGHSLLLFWYTDYYQWRDCFDEADRDCFIDGMRIDSDNFVTIFIAVPLIFIGVIGLMKWIQDERRRWASEKLAKQSIKYKAIETLGILLKVSAPGALFAFLLTVLPIFAGNWKLNVKLLLISLSLALVTFLGSKKWVKDYRKGKQWYKI